MLITLYLIDKGILRRPTLYLSDFFERNKSEYYDALTKVRTDNDIEHWIKFFLVGVAETASSSRETFERIVDLRQESERKIIALGRRAQVAQQLLQVLYSLPIISANQIATALGISFASVTSLVKSFEGLGILEEITGYRRNRLFRFSEYLNLFSEKIDNVSLQK